MLRQKKRVPAIVMLLCGLYMLSACSLDTQQVLRIATNTWPGYEALYIAKDLQLFDQENIHLIQMTSASEAIHALKSGTVEAASLTLDEAISILASSKIELVTVLVFDFSNGGDVLLSRPHITELKQLRGKVIAVEHSGVGAIMIDAALEAAQLKPSDVEIKYCPFDQHASCYQNSDAVVTFDPVKTQLENQGALELFSSKEIKNHIVDVLVVRKEHMETQGENIKNLLKAYFKAREEYLRNPEEISKLSTGRMQIKAGEVVESYKGIHIPDVTENKELLGKGSGGLQKVARKLSKIMYDAGLISEEIPIDIITTIDYLPSTK